MQPKGAIEAVVIFFVLNQNRPRLRIEIIHIAKGQPLLHCLKQIQQFTGRYRHTGIFQHMEEINEHGFSVPRGGA